MRPGDALRNVHDQRSKMSREVTGLTRANVITNEFSTGIAITSQIVRISHLLRNL